MSTNGKRHTFFDFSQSFVNRHRTCSREQTVEEKDELIFKKVQMQRNILLRKLCLLRPLPSGLRSLMKQNRSSRKWKRHCRSESQTDYIPYGLHYRYYICIKGRNGCRTYRNWLNRHYPTQKRTTRKTFRTLNSNIRHAQKSKSKQLSRRQRKTKHRKYQLKQKSIRSRNATLSRTYRKFSKSMTNRHRSQSGARKCLSPYSKYWTTLKSTGLKTRLQL